MPVPTLVTDLSTTAASNSPSGSDNVFPDLDNYLRALSAFLASIRDNSGNGWTTPYLPLTYSAGTANGVVYLNGSKVVTTGSALVFDGTNFSTTGTATATKLIPTGGAATGNGMYLPAANTLAWSNNGAETMRLDSSGNLGLGVTPSAWTGSGAKVLEFGSKGNAILGNTSVTDVTYNAYFDSAWKYGINGFASYYAQTGGTHQWFNAPTGTAGNAISFTQAMTLDASGNLGVGTSPSARIHALGGSTTEVRITSSGDVTTGAASIVRFGGSNSQTSGYIGYGGAASTIDVWNALSGSITFGTNNTERARITSGGDLLVGTTTTLNSSKLVSYAGSAFTGATVRSDSATAAGTGWWHFYGTSSGNAVANIAIYGNGDIQNANNSYGALSDLKLKENVIDATPKLDGLMRVRVVNYNLKNDPGHKQIGVIAQELEQVFPSMVEEIPDRDVDGELTGETTKAVKYSVFVPILIKAIQEQQALITALTARVAALEAL